MILIQESGIQDHFDLIKPRHRHNMDIVHYFFVGFPSELLILFYKNTPPKTLSMLVKRQR